MGAVDRQMRIGDRFVLQLDQGVLLEHGTRVPVGGRAMDLLCALAELAPAVVSKRELMDRVWPRVVVEENNLAAQVLTLRRMLGPGVIITVSGRGYRLDTQSQLPVPQAHQQLLERTDCLQALEVAWQTAHAGKGRAVLVYGEAGIGKSALCSAFLAEIRNARILRGSCEALFTPRPLGPLQDIAPQLGADISGLLTGTDNRAALFTQVLAVLEQQPTVWLVEDAHWADGATLDLLKFLGRRIGSKPVLLLLTYRDDELGPDHSLRTLLGDLPRPTTRIRLQALSEPAVEHLAHQAGRDARGVFHLTSGNPFYVTELLEAGGLPPSVSDAVMSRVARQSPQARELLDLLSVSPGAVAHGLLLDTAACSQNVLEEIISSGLVVATRGAFGFRHELARMAVLNSLSALRIRALHLRLLHALEAAGNSSEWARYVHHARGSGDQERILRYAALAAEEASRQGAHGQSAAHYETALETLGGNDLEQRAIWLEARARELYLSGCPPRTVDVCHEATELWRKLTRVREEGRCLQRLSRCHWSLGHGADAVRYAETALQLLEAIHDSVEYGWAMSTRSQLYMLASAYRDALALGTHALQIATRHDDPELLAHALNNVGSARVFLGEIGPGLAELERSLVISQANRFDDHVARALVNLINVTTALRRYPAAREWHAEAATFFASRDLDNYRDYIASWRAVLEFELGEWTLAAQTCEEGCQSPFRLPRLHHLLVRARMRAYLNESGSAEDIAGAQEIAAGAREIQRLAPVALARAEIQWCQGNTIQTDSLLECLSFCGEGASFRYLEELAFWLWRAGVERSFHIDAASPYALQIAGEWQAAARCWRELGVPLREAHALWDGDREARKRAREIYGQLGVKTSFQPL